MASPEFFISYSWNDQSLEVTEALDKFFQEKGITIIRDNRDIGYKGLIKDYMQQLGRGRYVVVVLSDAYFKSKSCMYELIQLAEHQDFYDRIFPVTVEGTSIYEAEDLLKYVNFWDEKIENLDTLMKQTKSGAHLQGVREDLDLYTEIRQNIARLIDFLRNINTHPLRGSDFEPLYAAIHKKMEQDDQSSEEQPKSEPKTYSHDPRLNQQIADQEELLSLINEKLSALKRAEVTTADPDMKFSLKHKIAEIEADRQKVEQELQELQRKK